MRGRGYGNGSLRKVNGSWVLDFTDELGLRRREVLSTRKADAEQLQAEIIANRNRRMRGIEAAPDDIQLDQLKSLYLADLRTRASAKHVINVESQLARVLAAIPAQSVAQVKPLMVVQFRTCVLAEGRSNRWANVLVQSLKGMLRWAHGMDLIARDPLAGVKKLPEGKRQQVQARRALNDLEIEALLQAAREEDRELSVRLRVPQAPFWRAVLETGARYGELRAATWAYLDEKNAVLTLSAKSTKAGKERRIPLAPDLVTELLSLKTSHWKVTGLPPTLGDPIFLSTHGRPWPVASNNINRHLKRLLKRAQIDRVDARGEKVDFHALRHSFASRLARNGVPLTQAQRLLGHSDPKLTAQVYTHLDVEDLRGAIESMGDHGPRAKPNRKEAM